MPNATPSLAVVSAAGPVAWRPSQATAVPTTTAVRRKECIRIMQPLDMGSWDNHSSAPTASSVGFEPHLPEHLARLLAQLSRRRLRVVEGILEPEPLPFVRSHL